MTTKLMLWPYELMLSAAAKKPIRVTVIIFVADSVLSVVVHASLRRPSLIRGTGQGERE